MKTNPVGNEVLWKGNDASAGQVEQACHAARARFRRGRNSRSLCAGIVEKFASLLEANKTELTRTIARDQQATLGSGD